MNTLNPLNLSTPNVPSLTDFFQQVFGFRIVAERGSGNLVIMRSDDGFVLTLMHDKSLSDNPYPSAFHLGFLQPNRDAVLALYARLQTLGFPAPRQTYCTGITGISGTFSDSNKASTSSTHPSVRWCQSITPRRNPPTWRRRTISVGSR